MTNKISRANVTTEERFQFLEQDGHACIHCQTKVGFYTAQIVRIQPKSAEREAFVSHHCLCATCSDRLVPPTEFWSNITEGLKSLLKQNQWLAS